MTIISDEDFAQLEVGDYLRVVNAAGEFVTRFREFAGQIVEVTEIVRNEQAVRCRNADGVFMGEEGYTPWNLDSRHFEEMVENRGVALFNRWVKADAACRVG